MPEFTPIELHVINAVKLERKRQKISQETLSVKAGYSEGFIGLIESPNQPEKYNVDQLNNVAKVLKCSPRIFWPDEAL